MSIRIQILNMASNLNDPKLILFKLNALKKNSFRSSFKMNSKELDIAKDLFRVQEACVKIITTRLAPANPKNDGSQTPYHGHPVFPTQHATGTCCRSCLFKWHQIQKGKELSQEEIMYICRLIRTWIKLNSCESMK